MIRGDRWQLQRWVPSLGPTQGDARIPAAARTVQWCSSWRSRSQEAKKVCLFTASFLLLVRAAGTASASQVVRPAPLGSMGTLQRSACPIEIPAGLAEGQSVLCGYATVPDQHGRPGGPTLRLTVAKFPSLSKPPSADALVLLAGGPGESNLLAFVPGMGSLVGRCFRAKRDVVVIELRGLFYSEPNLLCPERFDTQEAQLDQDPNNPRAVADDMDSIRRCRQRLTNRGVNLAAFSNTETAADIVTVMTALGYETFDLYANSAGTMLAQQVMGTYPARLRAVVLGSTVPLAAPIWPSMPANGIRALRRLFETCATDLACQHAYPALEATFLSLIDKLNRAPVTLMMRNPTTQKPFHLLLTGDRLSQWIYNLLLNDATAGRSVPFIISRVAAEDYRPLRLGAGLVFAGQQFRPWPSIFGDLHGTCRVRAARHSSGLLSSVCEGYLHSLVRTREAACSVQNLGHAPPERASRKAYAQPYTHLTPER
jgi:pimeloyl-ACP methyl ester carboxylesterase